MQFTVFTLPYCFFFIIAVSRTEGINVAQMSMWYLLFERARKLSRRVHNQAIYYENKPVCVKIVSGIEVNTCLSFVENR